MAKKYKNKGQEQAKDPPKTGPVQSATTRYAWLIALGIVLLTYIVYIPSLQNGFTTWDDPAYVLENKLVVRDTVPFKEIFTTQVESNYHPLTMLTLAWNYQSGKLDAKGYHEENLVLHLLNTALVFFFIFLLTRRNLLMPSIVSLFFGIHPMHVESVAWISERKDVLYVFFFLVGLISYLYYRKTKKAGWYALTFLLFLLSCLSKGMAVVFPVVLLLIDYLWDIKWNRKLLLEKLPFFAFSLAFGIVAYKIQETDKALVHTMNLFHRTMVASYGTIMYVVKFFVPYKLSAFYPYPEDENGNKPIIFYLCPFILAGLAALVYFFLRKEKGIMFGLLFYLTTIALVSQFITVGGAVMAERYSYLSYVGLLFATAYVVNSSWQGKSLILFKLKYPLTAIIILGAVVFCFQTYARTQVWENSDTLFTDALNKTPGPQFYYMRGLYYEGKGESDKAVEDFTKVVAKDSIANHFYNVAAYAKRGLIFKEERQYLRAEDDYNKVILLNKNFENIFVNRGLLYDEMREYNKAIADYTVHLQSKPTDHLIYNTRGLCYLKLGERQQALADFSRAIELNPSIPNYWLNRSVMENALNNNEDARADARQAIKLGMPVDTNYRRAIGLK